MSLSVRADRRYIRLAHRSLRYAIARVEAPTERRTSERPPINVAFVLDRSGSMEGSKIALARSAVVQAVRALGPRDRFSVVVYDDRIDVLIESTLASDEAKRMVVGRLESIDARGSTDLAGGWLRGCDQIAQHVTSEGLGRCLLLTDGLANVGIVDHDELERHASELRRRGVATTTFGVGTDFSESLLQRMAGAGGGHFYFIESPGQIPDYLASELGEALEVVARDAVLEVRTGSGVEVQPLTTVTAEHAPGATRLLLGDLVTGQVVDVIMQVRFPTGIPAGRQRLEFALHDRDGVLAGSDTLLFEYADDATNDRQPRDRTVDVSVASVLAARARQSAVHENRTGQFGAAVASLREVAASIAGFAGDDPALLHLVENLEGDALRLAAPAPELYRKRMHSAAANVMFSRDADGKAVRTRRS